MPKFIKLAAPSLLILLTLFSSLFLVANAQQEYRGIIVSPTIQEIEAEKGKDYNFDITLENNNSDQNYSVTVLKQTFQAGQDEGQPILKEFNTEDKSASWIGTFEPKFDLKPKEKKISQIKISIPTMAEAGSYYYAIVYEVKNSNLPEGSNVIINQRIASLIFVQVQGQVKREASFTNFYPNLYIVDPIFDNLQLNYRIQVEGNSYLRPAGNIFVYSNKDEPNNTLDLNPDRKILLSNSARNFSIYSSPFLSIPFVSSGVSQSGSTSVRQVEIDRPIFGNKNVEVNMTYSNSDGQFVKTNGVVNVWFIPWKLLLLIVLILAPIIALAIWVARKRKLRN